MLSVNIEFPGNATRLPLMTPAAVEAALSLIKGSELPLFYSYVVWRGSLQFIQDLSKIYPRFFPFLTGSLRGSGVL